MQIVEDLLSAVDTSIAEYHAAYDALDVAEYNLSYHGVQQWNVFRDKYDVRREKTFYHTCKNMQELLTFWKG